MKDDKTYRKADNVISEHTQNNDKSDAPVPYNKIVNEIDKEKSYIKFVDDIRDRCININKKFNKCLDLLSLSIRGPETNRTIDEILSNNMAAIATICDTLDGEKEGARNRLNNLYYKKDNFGKEEENKKDNKSEIE